VEDLNRETIYFGHYRSIFNHCDLIGQQSNQIRWKKRKIMLFKVEVGINQKPACDFLLAINSNWHPISHCFGVIKLIVEIWIGLFCVIEHLFWWLRDNVWCSSWAHWKARSGLPISVNWTFSLGVTADALRAKQIENRFLKAGKLVCTKFSRRKGRLPPVIFAWIVRPINVLQLCGRQFSNNETL